jgi:hypothetical protein
VASGPEGSERTRVAAWESVCGAVMLIGGVLLARLGSIAGVIGLGLLFLGIGGLGHAVLYGLGLVDLPSGQERRSEGTKDDDVR